MKPILFLIRGSYKREFWLLLISKVQWQVVEKITGMSCEEPTNLVEICYGHFEYLSLTCERS
jgi:hypothetical protein